MRSTDEVDDNPRRATHHETVLWRKRGCFLRIDTPYRRSQNIVRTFLVALFLAIMAIVLTWLMMACGYIEPRMVWDVGIVIYLVTLQTIRWMNTFIGRI